MSDKTEELQGQITALEGTLRIPGLPDATKQQLELTLQGLRAQQATLAAAQASAATRGVADVSGTVYGPVTGVNLGTIQAFFGATKPPEDGAALLANYLDVLARDCDELRLSRLTGRRQTGAERGTAPPLRLQDVYTSLTTDGPEVVVHQRQRSVGYLRKLVARLQLDQRSTDACAPELVRRATVLLQDNRFVPERSVIYDVRAWADPLLAGAPDNELAEFQLVRPELAPEAIHLHSHLVLLGEPGHGKSTVLRYLAHLLTRRGLGEAIDLPGWPASDAPVPILVPLGSVAAALEAHAGDADKALWHVLGDILDGEQGI